MVRSFFMWTPFFKTWWHPARQRDLRLLSCLVKRMVACPPKVSGECHVGDSRPLLRAFASLCLRLRTWSVRREARPGGIRRLLLASVLGWGLVLTNPLGAAAANSLPGTIKNGASNSEAVPMAPQNSTIVFHVLKAWKVDLGNRSIFYNLVAPPVFPSSPSLPPAPVAAPISAEAAEAFLRLSHKKLELLFFSATVYDRRVTELRWSDKGREYRAFSNIDFNCFSGPDRFETEDTVYLLEMGIGNETTDQVEGSNRFAPGQGQPKEASHRIPGPEAFSSTRAEYFLVKSEFDLPPPAEALAGMDALHRYYNANRNKLLEDCLEREASRLAQERWLAEHPPVPKDTIIHFWPKENSVYLGSGKEGKKP